MLTTWWIWIAAGVVLAGLEVVLPSYIFLGFALGALVTGGLLALGGPLTALLVGSVPTLLVIFALASLGGWIALRLTLGVRTDQVRTFDRDVNDG